MSTRPFLPVSNVFNPSLFSYESDYLTIADADQRYLRIGENITANSISCNTFYLGGSLINVDAIAGVTAGTASPSKALIVDANKDITGIRYLIATNLMGTVQTAAQPNITSLGTLTTLKLNGSFDFGSNVNTTMNNNLIITGSPNSPNTTNGIGFAFTGPTNTGRIKAYNYIMSTYNNIDINDQHLYLTGPSKRLGVRCIPSQLVEINQNESTDNRLRLRHSASYYGELYADLQGHICLDKGPSPTDNNDRIATTYWVKSVTGASANHNSLSNLQLAGAGVTYGHIDDQQQTIAGVKRHTQGLQVGDASKLGFLGTDVNGISIGSVSNHGITFINGSSNQIAHFNTTGCVIGSSWVSSPLGSLHVTGTSYFGDFMRLDNRLVINSADTYPLTINATALTTPQVIKINSTGNCQPLTCTVGSNSLNFFLNSTSSEILTSGNIPMILGSGGSSSFQFKTDYSFTGLQTSCKIGVRTQNPSVPLHIGNTFDYYLLALKYDGISTNSFYGLGAGIDSTLVLGKNTALYCESLGNNNIGYRCLNAHYASSKGVVSIGNNGTADLNVLRGQTSNATIRLGGIEETSQCMDIKFIYNSGSIYNNSVRLQVYNTSSYLDVSYYGVGIGIDAPNLLAGLDIRLQKFYSFSSTHYAYNVSGNAWSSLSSGGMYLSMYAASNILVNNAVYSASDRRLKSNIHDLDFKLLDYMNLRSKEYIKKSKQSDTTFEVGLIAQDVCRDSPSISRCICNVIPDPEMKCNDVDDPPDGWGLAIDYNKLAVVNMSVIQQLVDRIEKLEEKNRSLENCIHDLGDKLSPRMSRGSNFEF